MAVHKWHRIADLLAERLANHAFCEAHPRSEPDAHCPFCQDRTAYADYLTAGGTEFRHVPGPDERAVSLVELAAMPHVPGEWASYGPEPEPACPVYLTAKAVRGGDGHAVRPGSPLAACGARAVATSQDAVKIPDILPLLTCVTCSRQLRAALETADLEPPPVLTATARYAFNPRQRNRNEVRCHAVLDVPLTAPRFARAAGDALCKPRSKFWGLSEGSHAAAVDCPRCIVLAERYGVMIPRRETR